MVAQSGVVTGKWVLEGPNLGCGLCNAKSMIYTPKQDDEDPQLFTWRSLPRTLPNIRTVPLQDIFLTGQYFKHPVAMFNFSINLTL